MTQYTSLRSFYAERAELAYTIEHMTIRDATTGLARYDALKAEIASLEAAWAQSWRPPRIDIVPPPLLPWCSICGRDDRELLPGRTLCAMCETIIATGCVFTPGEHAEVERIE